MAEKTLSSVAGGILGMLGSLAAEEIILLWGVKDELEQLKDTVSTIEAVLLNAEKKQNHNNQVKLWLQRLQEVILDADDLVDDLSYEALRKSLMPGNNSMVKQVRTFFSSSNQLVHRHNIGKQIKDVRKKLAAIGNDRIHLNLEEHHGVTKVVNRQRDHTDSFVSDEEVIGRGDDSEEIVRLLKDAETKEKVRLLKDAETKEKVRLLKDAETKEKLSIMPIVGIGGVGKTTLAKLVFNDEQVKKHFDLRLWVCVSDNFDVKLLLEKIIKSANVKLEKNEEMGQLQSILHEKINGKRFLLVLDDVWIENYNTWCALKCRLLNGAEGSKVIVTTRSKIVARITGTMPAYDLKAMDKEKSWALFKKIALEQGRESNISSNISEIRKHIVDKCGGNPLAIKTIAGLLRLKNPETEWSSFVAKEFSKIPEAEDDIIPTLKLSYDHLPSSLKQCFVYLSLFPKDYEIDVEILVQLWMAQGFIKISDPTDCLVDMGYEYFKELLWRSFFEKVETDENGNVTKCKMHDLMHDLAESIARPEFDRRIESTEPINRKARHVFLYNFDLELVRKIQPSLIQAKKMRTIAMHEDKYRTWWTNYAVAESRFDAIACNLKLLRTMDLQHFGIAKVPKSIGKLKHLRYLDLSENSCMVLPDCITRLHNLQTLKLSRCEDLQVLPEDINKLINLRILEIDGCSSLKYMPRGIGELSSLRKLSKFTLSKENMSFSSNHQGGGGLDELGRLNNLRGRLEIENLRIDAMVQRKDAILKEKQHLQSLDLRWIEDVTLEEKTDAVVEGYEMQLEGLQPHPNLKYFYIGKYQGVRFPSWFDSHTNLVTLGLWRCYKCQHLPPLHQLPCLKNLELRQLHALEYVSKDEYLSCSSSSSSASIFFPSLEVLWLFGLPNLKGWWGRSDSSSATARSTHDRHMLRIFPNCLFELTIEGCPSLTCMPLFPYVSHRVWWNDSSWIPFQQTILSVSGGRARPINVQPSSSSSSSSSSSTSSYYPPLCKLTILDIYCIRDLQFLPDELKSLTSLKDLSIGCCQELKSLYPGIQHLTSLQKLRIKYCQHLNMHDDEAHAITLWQQPLKRLQTLSFERLPQLVDLPSGLQHLTRLRKLEISDCKNLVSFPEWIKSLTSLQYLDLYCCPKLASLPEEIISLTSLHTLKIAHCDTLKPRCEWEKGEDWPKISHIPDLQIY